MIISLDDVIVIFVYLLITFFQFISIFYIVSHFTQFNNTRTLFAISSPFIFIVFGLPFHFMGLLYIYPFIQIIFFLIISAFILKNFTTKINILNFFRKKYILYFLSFIFLIIFLSYDSRSYLSYGFADSTTSHDWFESIQRNPKSGYQSGMAIYLSPLYFLVNPGGSLDYLGFIVGLVLLLFTAGLLEILKKYLSIYFIALYTLPFFVEAQKSLIGLSNNQFYILYIPLIIYLIFHTLTNTHDSKLKVILLGIVLLSLTITSPALSLYLGYLLIIYIFVIPIFFKKSIKKLFYICLFHLIGVGLYLINLKESVFFVMGFTFTPNPETKIITDSQTTTKFAIISEGSLDKLRIFILELLKVKFLENPTGSIFILAGYTTLVFMVFILIYLIIIKNTLYVLLCLAGVIFGLSTLTGFGQYSFIMGRVGWYYMIVVIILNSLLISDFVDKFSFKKTAIALWSLILLLNSLRPPVEYRYDDEIFHIEISRLASESVIPIILYSTLKDNRVYRYKNLNVLLIEDLGQYLRDCESSECNTLVVAIDKNKSLPDPALSRAINKEIIGDSKQLSDFYSSRATKLATNIALEKDLLELGFDLYFENVSGSLLVRR